MHEEGKTKSVGRWNCSVASLTDGSLLWLFPGLAEGDFSYCVGMGIHDFQSVYGVSQEYFLMDFEYIIHEGSFCGDSDCSFPDFHTFNSGKKLFLREFFQCFFQSIPYKSRFHISISVVVCCIAGMFFYVDFFHVFFSILTISRPTVWDSLR